MSTRIGRLIAALERRLPGVRVEEDPPASTGGIRFLDILYRGRRAVIQWHAREGFGLWRGRKAFFGEGPHEVHGDPAVVAARTAELLRNNAYTAPPREAPIVAVRLLRGLTQEGLARRLGVRQSAVSKLERKRDLRIGTLRRIVRALGGRLVLRVEWPDHGLDLAPSPHSRR